MLYTTKGYQLFSHPRATNKQMNFTTRVYSDLVRDFFAYYPHFNRTSSPVALDAIEFQYTPWNLPVITSQDIINAVDKATGDWAFGCPVVSWADSYVELPPAPMVPPPSPPKVPPNYGDEYEVNLKTGEKKPSSVRYVRLKRSFASGFSYLQSPNKETASPDKQSQSMGAQNTAMRNPDSIYSAIPESDMWYSKHKVFLYYFTQRSSQVYI